MTRTQLRASLLRRLGNRSDLTNADLDVWIDAGLLDLGTRRFTFRELESAASQAVSALGSIYPRPADAFAIQFLRDDTNKRLVRPWAGSFESFVQALQSATLNPGTADIATFFIERGANFLVTPPPTVGGFNWTVYYYAKPAMGADGSNSPNIDDYWHKGIELLAFKYAADDLGDDERADRAEREWNEWFGARDTPKRRSDRSQVPSAPIRPHGSWVRNTRTGV